MSAPESNADLIFGKYEIQTRLAIGGMGEVFFAVQHGVQGFERPAILKNLLPDLAQQEGFVEQFLDEARVAATLNHPNVVSIYEVGLWNGTYFIAMEYIQGRNVAQLIKAALRSRTQMPPLVAAQVIRDAALGLHHAHVAKDPRGVPLNIVHRDISPQNIMVRDDGVTKVVDFGIARAANRSTRTQTGTVKGKLAYMPPEQVLASAELTALADQYSLGIVLWEMCTGRRLFRADHDMALMKLVLESNIPRLTELEPSIPGPLADVVARMVHREPGGRFPTCAHVAKELDRLLDQHVDPSEESPVAHFLRSLGPWDVPTPQATPTGPKRNFVISLDRASPASGMALPPGEAAGPSVEVDLAPTGAILTPTGSRGATPQGGARRRAPLVAGALLAVALAAVGAWRLAAEPPPPPVVVVTPPPQPPVAEPAPVVTPPPPERPPAVGTAKWSLKTTPPGAAVRLDGRPLGTSPVELTVSSGESHFLLIEKPGFRRDERELEALGPGEGRVLEVPLVALKAVPTSQPQPVPVTAQVPAKGPGFLTLSTTPWTKVSVGRDVLGSTPLFKVKLPAGEHVLTLVNEGQNLNTTRKVTIRAGEVTKLDLQL